MIFCKVLYFFCNFWRTDRQTDRQTDRPTDLGIKAPSQSLKSYSVTTLRWYNITTLQCCNVAKFQSCKVAMLQCCNVANLKSCKVATWLQTDVRTYGWTGVLLELLLELKNILTLSWKSIYYVETQPASLVRRTFKEMIVNPHKHSRAHRALV